MISVKGVTRLDRTKLPKIIVEQKTFKGRNFITPNVQGYYQVGKFIVELSTGKGIFTDKLYGCTVANITTGKNSDALSTCFSSLSDVENHIAILKTI